MEKVHSGTAEFAAAWVSDSAGVRQISVNCGVIESLTAPPPIGPELADPQIAAWHL